jgi:hypothetical protein
MSYINHGRLLAEHYAKLTDAQNLEVAISTPARFFVSSLICIGIRIGFTQKMVNSFSQEAHFQKIQETPIGHKIRYYNTQKSKPNVRYLIYKGVEIIDNEPYIRLDYPNKNASQFISPTIATHVLRENQLPQQNIEQQLIFLSDFGLSINKSDVEASSFSTDTNACIIGEKGTLTNEVEALVRTHNFRNKPPLPIKDLLGIGTQTLLASSIVNETEQELTSQKPAVVIYEDLASVVKFRDAYTPKIRIYLINREKPTSRDYLKKVNEFYNFRSPDGEITSLSPEPMAGVETLTFFGY